ncbi:MAG: hypothetical protein AAGJ46_12970 [Planctomycetota bacterium]
MSSLHPYSRTALPAVLLLAAIATPSAATIVVDSEGFESPRFVAGSIEGQDGWVSSGTQTGSPSTAVVQSTDVFAGSNALLVDRPGGSERFWAKPIPDGPTGRFTYIDWRMKVEQVAMPTGFGPFMGVVAFDASSSIAFVASLFVDGSTGDIVYQQAGTGFYLETGAIAQFDAWIHYTIELDYQLDEYTVFADAIPLVTSRFIDDPLIEVDRITDADIATRPAGLDPVSSAATTSAVFDNFVVRDGLRGDYNDDGQVDAADYTVWRDELGQVGFGLAADGDASGTVGPEDYQVWLRDFGRSNALAAAAAVPEPAAVIVALMALAAYRPLRCVPVKKA